MSKRLIAGILCSAIGLIGASGFAFADSIGGLECNIIGPIGLDPIGDRDGHLLRSYDYSCVGVDGLFKGAVSTGLSVSEMDGPQVTFLLGAGVVRTAGGLAVGQMLDGTGATVMQEGRPARATLSGKVMFKFASGTLAALSGKTVKSTAKPIGFNRFELEYGTEIEPGITALAHKPRDHVAFAENPCLPNLKTSEASDEVRGNSEGRRRDGKSDGGAGEV
jgi:hypothetical protein